MNPAQLLAHFDRISEAPDAIPRLRQFILELAVRGKLVEQNPTDEPWSAARMSPPNRHRDSELASGPWTIELPTSWQWTTLASIAEQITDGEHATPQRIAEHEVPLVTAKNVRDGFMDYSNTNWVSLETAKKAWQRCHPNVDDILLVCVGATTGRLCVLREARDMVLVRSVALIRAGSTIDVDYLALALRSPTSQSQIWAKVKTTAQPCLYINRINSLAVPVPAVPEQQRIVAKVNELMGLCDRLEAAHAERESRRDRLAAASLHRLNHPADTDGPEVIREHARFYLNHLPRLTTRPEQIKQLRQTILNLAVRGKLVHQDPNDEPASELLKRIQAERMRSTKSRLNQPQQPQSGSGEPFSAVPDGWKWVRFGSLLLGDSQNGYSKKPDDAADGIPILRISAGTVRKDGIVAEEEYKLIGGVSAAQQQQYELQSGDLLACRFNGNRNFVGRLSLYLGYLGTKPIYPDKLIRLRLVSQFVLPKLVRYLAESSVVRKDIENYCATTVGNWGISASNLREVNIPLPPLAEQHRIIAKLDELMSLCDQLEAQLTTAQTEGRRLLEAILHKALTPAVLEGP
jgi:type I restriction enzyme S subunit